MQYWNKATKILATVLLGTLGIYMSTLVFGPLEWDFWAEYAKTVPGWIVALIAYAAAQDANESSARSELEGRAARESAERAEVNAGKTDSERRKERRATKRADKALSKTMPKGG